MKFEWNLATNKKLIRNNKFHYTDILNYPKPLAAATAKKI